MRHDIDSCLVVLAGPIATLESKDHGSEYREILADQDHPVMQTLFPKIVENFQVDNAPIHAEELVQSWFDQHKDEVKHILLPIVIQSQYN